MRLRSAFSLFAVFVCVSSFVSLDAQDGRDALLEFRQGRFESAVETCIAEIKAEPDNMDAYSVLCWSLIKLSRYDDAARYAEQGRTFSRYDPRLAEALGEARFYQGRNEDALKLFQEYITLAPEGGRIDVVYYFLGEIYARMGRFRHADIAFSTAVRYVPGNAQWWVRLAYARERAGENRHAVEAYEKTLSLDPQSVDAQRGLERTRKALSSNR